MARMEVRLLAAPVGVGGSLIEARDGGEPKIVVIVVVYMRNVTACLKPDMVN